MRKLSTLPKNFVNYLLKLIKKKLISMALHAYRMNAQQVVGPSDVSKHGRSSKAWSQGRNRSNQEEFLHVGNMYFALTSSLQFLMI